MNTKHLRLIYLFSIFLIFLAAPSLCQSQIISKLGIKGGFLITGLHTFNQNEMFTDEKPNTFISDSSRFFSSLNFDIGIYTEWFNSDHFCISTELHYRTKDEPDTAFYIVPHQYYDPRHFVWRWETGILTDNTQYLSFQILPRFRMVISPDNRDNIFVYGGPNFDFAVKDNSYSTKPKYTNRNYFFSNIGGIFGGGFEWNQLITAEIRIEHDFTGPYDFRYKNDEIARRYTTFTFLLGISIYKHKK